MNAEQPLLLVGDDERTRTVCEAIADRLDRRLAAVGVEEVTESDGDDSAAGPAGAVVSPIAGAAGVRRLRGRYPSCPVVAFHDAPEAAADALSAGATHALRLPANGPEKRGFDEAVREATAVIASPGRTEAGESGNGSGSESGSGSECGSGNERESQSGGGSGSQSGSQSGSERESDSAASPDAGTEAVSAIGAETNHVAASGGAIESAADPPVSVTEFFPKAVDRLPDVLYIYEVDGTMVTWNARFASVTGYGADEIAEMRPTEFVAPDHRATIETAIERVVSEGVARETADLLTADGERIPHELTGVLVETGDERAVIAGTGRDITERRRNERALERQTARLRTLNHINAVIREVNEALVRTETREEIETAVCERLAAAEPYRLVWIGEFDVRGEDVVTRAYAGEGTAYLEERAASTARWQTAAAAMRDGEVKVVERMSEAERRAPRHEAAVEHGLYSGAGIPITYRGRTYGVLCVYAPRPDAFDDRERTVLRELGETIGYAISAAERRHALLSDAVTEVELDLTAPGPVYVEASAAVEGAVRLDGVVETDGELTEFLRVPTASVPDFRAHAADAGLDPSIVTERGGESVVRVRLGDRSLAALVADHGGMLTSGVAETGRGTATVELPASANVRDLVDRLDELYTGGVRLRAQREREPAGVSGLRFRGVLDEALTPRQREVVETASHAGFFEWPRESTAEEVAALLDITAPTFHEHLRHAQRKLVASYLDGGGPTHTS